VQCLCPEDDHRIDQRLDLEVIPHRTHLLWAWGRYSLSNCENEETLCTPCLKA
jgi:hypothetical protein